MIAYYHLPGLFEFYELYRLFLPLFREHREFFYDWCEIGSIYGAPGDCIWGGGRVGFGDEDPVKVRDLMNEYNIPARLTFSNLFIEKEHLSDRKCNELCRLFEKSIPDAETERRDRRNAGNTGASRGGDSVRNGIIVSSDLLMDHIRKNYPEYYFVSSTTKVLTDINDLKTELEREEFEYVVPDFRLNRKLADAGVLRDDLKRKVEFLCNECCYFGCSERKSCYENVSRKCLGEDVPDHFCASSGASKGYRFSDAMKNPGFIGTGDILNIYMPAGFSQFKIEGRSLGSAMILEFLLYYMTKPEYRLNVREEIYLDSSLDLF